MKNFTIATIAAVLAFIAGRFIFQPKPQIKEVVKVVEVEKRVKEEKKKTRTEVKETVKPDGTKETTTIIVEDSAIKETGTKESKTNKELVAKSGRGVTFGVLALKDLDRFSDKPEFGVLTAVPVFGSLSIVGTADTTKRIGLGVALEF